MARGLRAATFTSKPSCILLCQTSHQPSSKSSALRWVRTQSTYTPTPSHSVAEKPTELSCSPLARLPTSNILRSLFLSFFFTSSTLFRPGLAIFSGIANSQSAFLNPDKNPIIRVLTRNIVYDQFCAGRNLAEIQRTSSLIRNLGFSGVALCYGKEVQLGADNKYHGRSVSMQEEIAQFRKGNLETVAMIKKGDWLAIKLTGAGQHVTQALMEGKPAPPEFVEAMNEICRGVAAKDCRIWIDAEQQALQSTIDSWTFDLMRQYNRGGKVLIYSTIQAYLKIAREKVQHQLQLAADEGWTLGIKLVRGAYIAADQRSKIHDTKADTDLSYNSIVDDLLRGQKFPVFDKNSNLKFELLLCGHNSQTIRTAAKLAAELASAGKLKVVPEFAQLQGMADDIGCELLQISDDAVKNSSSPAFVPKVYKCLTWGSIQECMQYLTRRLVENRGAADRMKEGAVQLRQELKRRFVGA
ncbi:proline dehydrogenase [Neophaeococcomyces mojaviensis]|uniref:Proline dehydrogenase n=1 Tax=Neophaeococcomyces mojaviensis TaxID=3383035 RepID=A0ACC2ZUT9_9EURO|nr:proline dehydrogenase [Knufia sp. JES_112]